MEKLATAVVEEYGKGPDGRYFTRVYLLDQNAHESGAWYKVTEIKITDDFGFTHAEIYLQGFGQIWITHIQKIIFKEDAERPILQTSTGTDIESEAPLSEQQVHDQNFAQEL